MKLNTRGDGWLALLIAVFTLVALIGMGAYAENRPCQEMGESYGYTAPMCKNTRLD